MAPSQECYHIPSISSSVQESVRHVLSVSLKASLGQVQSDSYCETQPATDAASVKHRVYRSKQLARLCQAKGDQVGSKLTRHGLT